MHTIISAEEAVAGTPAAAAVNGSGGPVPEIDDGPVSQETPETAARHCELYCALCTKHHVLLRELFIVFGQCKGLGRTAILRNAEGLARVLGPAAPSLIAIIDDTPPGSATLLLRMLNFLTEKQPPPQVPRLAKCCHGLTTGIAYYSALSRAFNDKFFRKDST